MAVRVRRAAPGDVADMLRLIVALATYEHEADAVKTTAESLTASLFGPDPKVFAHVAERDGCVVGLSVWFYTYSTWTGRLGLYLEDLFVDPEARRSGAARALFAALGEEARARDCARIDWGVLDWNESAKDFYRAIGGRRNDGWEPWRIDGEALTKL